MDECALCGGLTGHRKECLLNPTREVAGRAQADERERIVKQLGDTRKKLIREGFSHAGAEAVIVAMLGTGSNS